MKKNIASMTMLLGVLIPLAGHAESLLSKAEVSALLVGRTIIYSDGNSSTYSQNGEYAYSQVGVAAKLGVARGNYTLGEDGSVCVRFIANGRTRCDRFGSDGNAYVLITEKGSKYPFKLE